MSKPIAKFLEFNGKTIQFLSVDGTIWIAVKPICQALGVNFDRQYKNLKDDDILAGVYAKQPMHDSSGRLQEMVCLPEKYIYGWLFGIRSESEDLKAYKLACYDVLYEHFHGVMTQRLQVLLSQLEAQQDADKWTAELEQTEAYQKLQEAKERIKRANRQRSQLDQDLKAGQLSVFDKANQ